MIVVDASVAVKWFMPERGTKEAHALLLGIEKLVAPALIRVEVAAALTRKARVGEIPPDEALAACNLWRDALSQGVVTLTPDQELMRSAVAFAIGLKHPLQDCIYLALAHAKDAMLVTADAKFAERACSSYPKVQLLVAMTA